MKHFKALLVAMLLAVPAVPASAQTPFTFLNGGTVTAFGYYVGQYNGLMGSTPVILNCVDFFHHISVGQKWDAVLSSLAGPEPDLDQTRFGNKYPGALDLYRMAAWLTTRYVTNPEATGQIQATIWSMFADGTPQPSSDYWWKLAEGAYQTYDYRGFWVVTDVNAKTGGVQEFIMYNPTVTPEPVSMVLFGTGLLGLAPFAKRRKRRNEATAEV